MIRSSHNDLFFFNPFKITWQETRISLFFPIQCLSPSSSLSAWRYALRKPYKTGYITKKTSDRNKKWAISSQFDTGNATIPIISNIDPMSHLGSNSYYGNSDAMTEWLLLDEWMCESDYSEAVQHSESSDWRKQQIHLRNTSRTFIQAALMQTEMILYKYKFTI